MKEIWKDVEGYDGVYQVSSKGRVKSLDTIRWNGQAFYMKKGRILKQKLDDKGYYRINLYHDGKCRTYLVSRLVAQAFISNPNNLKLVGHDNDVKTDNTVENLYWTDYSENATHNGVHERVTAKRQLKINDIADALSKPVIGRSDTNGNTVLRFKSAHEAQRNGFLSCKISMCCNGKRKKHGGFTWEFEQEVV